MSAARRTSSWLATSPVTAIVMRVEAAVRMVISERAEIFCAVGAVWKVVTSSKVKDPVPTEAK